MGRDDRVRQQDGAVNVIQSASAIAADGTVRHIERAATGIRDATTPRRCVSGNCAVDQCQCAVVLEPTAFIKAEVSAECAVNHGGRTSVTEATSVVSTVTGHRHAGDRHRAIISHAASDERARAAGDRHSSQCGKRTGFNKEYSASVVSADRQQIRSRTGDGGRVRISEGKPPTRQCDCLCRIEQAGENNRVDARQAIRD